MTTEAARAASVRSLGRICAIIKEPSDRDVLAAFFATLFLQVYLWRTFIDGHSEVSLGTAELIGFAAIASMLQRLNSDRILRSWDYVVIALGGVAIVHPWSRVGPLVLTVLGLLFIFRSDRRRASLGQLCLGLAWIGLWGPLVFRLIEPWFLPMETALGYLPLSIVRLLLLGRKCYLQ